MTKYFYSDVLKAVWMAREFNFKYKVGNNECCTTDDFNSCIWNLNTKNIYYLHLDCHEALKPQDGDLVEWRVDGVRTTEGKPILGDGHDKPTAFLTYKDILASFFTCKNIPASAGGYGIYPITRFDVVRGEEKIEIIQRNGKAFFMPEIEND